MNMLPVLLFSNVFLAFFKEAWSFTLANQQMTLTMYNYSVSWNRAKATCVHNGGTLFIEDSRERSVVFETFSQNWPKMHLWIGLHYPITESNVTYGWTDCLSQNLDWFSKWKEGHPEFPSNERCAFSGSQFGHWKSKPCQRDLGFVCQNAGGPCTFANNSGQPLPSSDYQVLNVTVLDVDMCLHECLTQIYNFTNCWAVNYDSPKCTLYYTTDPFLFRNQTLTVSSAAFYTKMCYINNGTVVIEDTSITAVDSPIPDTDCVTFHHQTTPINFVPTSATSLVNSSVTVSQTPINTTSITSQQTTSTTTSLTVNTSMPVTSDAPTTLSATSTALPTSTTSNSLTQSPTSTNSTTSSTISAASTASAATILTSSTVSTKRTTIHNGSSAISAATSPSKISTQTTTTQITTCSCFCSSVTSQQLNLTLSEKLESIRVKLKIDTDTLSASIRKKTCAPDDRPSSKTIGLVAICTIMAEILLIIMADLINITRFLRKNVKKMYLRENKRSHKSL